MLRFIRKQVQVRNITSTGSVLASRSQLFFETKQNHPIILHYHRHQWPSVAYLVRSSSVVFHQQTPSQIGPSQATANARITATEKIQQPRMSRLSVAHETETFKIKRKLSHLIKSSAKHCARHKKSRVARKRMAKSRFPSLSKTLPQRTGNAGFTVTESEKRHKHALVARSYA